LDSFVFVHIGVERAISLARQADIIASLSTEALRGTVRHLHPSKYLSSCFSLKMFSLKSGLHASRPHTGQNLVAQRMRSLLNSPLHPSAISESHINCGKVQDAYSIRCIPQVSCYLINFSIMHNYYRFMVYHGIRLNLFKKSSQLK
jgi:histidine ammonia-lyase